MKEKKEAVFPTASFFLCKWREVFDFSYYLTTLIVLT